MESLAWFVTALLFVLLLMVVSTLVLSLLARLGKVPPVIGYVALGIQGAVTIFAFLISPTLLIPAVLVLVGCLLIQFLPKSRNIEHSQTMTDRRQLFGLVGSGLLILGTFFPLVSAPIIGPINYFANGKGDGIFIIGFGVLATVFTLIKSYKLLWIPAILSLGQLTYALFTFAQKMSESSGILSVSMEWGWLVLYAGGVLLFLAALAKNPLPQGSGSSA